MRPRIRTRVGQYIALAAYIVFLGFPLFWLVSTAFKSAPEFARLDPTLLPTQPTLSNFSTALQQEKLGRALINSFLVAICTSVITTVIAVPAAYAIARFRSKVRTAAIGWILVSQLFPFVLIVIPVFIVLKNLGLLNSLPGLVIVYVVWALPFTLWMLQGYVAAIPGDLEEAAAIDGATKLRVLSAIVFPLLVPGLVATGMFAFISAWNEFFFALVIITSPDRQTAPLLLARFVGAEGQISLGPLAASALITTLPALIVFAFAQRKLVSGLLAGAVKG
ncbi:carbohydrate ABC transporter permease [Microlunatus soli]|uniref:Carbohydrate ABC transporter membrane protein 2, CUT1 family n=1 Tax=Microlunatus soli TaxID=630515 RepID=A0A1H1YZ61_9ACTN|nr:carbohydrate ABC transporter permease [Microlunatus soli]SDT26708.1 carbohydrate ABC transporter membrane protein 2, CUT1 family [Microlunatus soli]